LCFQNGVADTGASSYLVDHTDDDASDNGQSDNVQSTVGKEQRFPLMILKRVLQGLAYLHENFSDAEEKHLPSKLSFQR